MAGNQKYQRVPLETAIDCRRELAKTYRQYRRGDIDDKTAKTSTYMLQNLVGIIRDHDFEQRLQRLKDSQSEK
jgi:hypothetical protein